VPLCLTPFQSARIFFHHGHAGECQSGFKAFRAIWIRWLLQIITIIHANSLPLKVEFIISKIRLFVNYFAYLRYLTRLKLLSYFLVILVKVVLEGKTEFDEVLTPFFRGLLPEIKLS
jgi:hypothetical protein